MSGEKLPTGDTETTTTEMGSLYVDHEHERLVVIDDYENVDGYRVFIYTVSGDDITETTEEWTPDEIKEFVSADHTGYLSGHNFPGNGYYGVFVGPAPDCPVCGKEMSPGSPDYHKTRGNGLPAVGYTCKEYERTNGVHEGFMRQQGAIDRGLYVTVYDYLQEMFGDG